MKQEIVTHIDNPAYLEKLYRSDKSKFSVSFAEVYPDIADRKIARFWQERLAYESNSISWGSKADLFFVVAASFMAGLIAKIPATFSISEDFFYPRNIGFIIFPFLTVFFAWKNKISAKMIAISAAIIAVCLLYINLLPDNTGSDTVIPVSYTHLLHQQSPMEAGTFQ